MCKAEWKRFTGSAERFPFIVVPWLWILFADDLKNKKDDGADAPFFTEKEIEAAYKNCDVQFEDFVYDMEEEYFEDMCPYEFLKELSAKDSSPRRRVEPMVY
jgi:hypothetical protein